MLPSTLAISHQLSGWTSDSAFLFSACVTRSGAETCAYGMDGNPRIVASDVRPGATVRRAVSPDGQWYLASDGRSVFELRASDGSRRRALPRTPAIGAVGHAGSAIVIGWSGDSSAVFAAGDALFGPELSVVRIDLESGDATPWRLLRPDDRAGDIATISAFVVGDGEGYVYGFRRTQSDLYLVEPETR
jgi:hypothetical protein